MGGVGVHLRVAEEVAIGKDGYELPYDAVAAVKDAATSSVAR